MVERLPQEVERAARVVGVLPFVRDLRAVDRVPEAEVDDQLTLLGDPGGEALLDRNERRQEVRALAEAKVDRDTEFLPVVGDAAADEVQAEAVVVRVGVAKRVVGTRLSTPSPM